MTQWWEKWLAIIVGLLASLGYRGPDRPVLNYGSGYYTNVCGSGLAANRHRCSGECDPVKGECVSSRYFAEKLVCDGRQTECTENENWGNILKVDEGVGCGKTAVINVFDKNCRVNGWSCTEDNLRDYLVWYSGDCGGDVTVGVSGTPTPSVKPSPTSRPSATGCWRTWSSTGRPRVKHWSTSWAPSGRFT